MPAVVRDLLKKEENMYSTIYFITGTFKLLNINASIPIFNDAQCLLTRAGIEPGVKCRNI